MLCHWPGMYCNGQKQGFADFKRIVRSLAARFESETIWMKLSEIGRYWCAKELTQFTNTENGIKIVAPFGTPLFTLETAMGDSSANPLLSAQGQSLRLKRVESPSKLDHGTWIERDGKAVICFELPKGVSHLVWT